ncbi:hypothetical protein IWW47_003523, partial [Coemansia sp. RSA 2052]
WRRPAGRGGAAYGRSDVRAARSPGAGIAVRGAVLGGAVGGWGAAVCGGVLRSARAAAGVGAGAGGAGGRAGAGGGGQGGGAAARAARRVVAAGRAGHRGGAARFAALPRGLCVPGVQGAGVARQPANGAAVRPRGLQGVARQAGARHAARRGGGGVGPLQVPVLPGHGDGAGGGAGVLL